MGMVKIVSYTADTAQPQSQPARLHVQQTMYAPAPMYTQQAPVSMYAQQPPMYHMQPGQPAQPGPPGQPAQPLYAQQSAQLYPQPTYLQPGFAPQPMYAPPYAQPYTPGNAPVGPPPLIISPSDLAPSSVQSPVTVRSSGWRLDMQHKTQERVKQEWQAAELQKQIEEKRLKKEALEEERRRRDAKEAKEEAEYNPWGRGGAGAPLRDGAGNLHTNLRLKGEEYAPQPLPPSIPAQPATPMPPMPAAALPLPIAMTAPPVHGGGGPVGKEEEESIFSLVARPFTFGAAPVGAAPQLPVPFATPHLAPREEWRERSERQPPSVPLSSARRGAPEGKSAADTRRVTANRQPVRQPMRTVGSAPGPSAVARGKPPPHSGGYDLPRSRGCSSSGSSSKPPSSAGTTRRGGRAPELEAALQQRDGQIHELRRQVERQQALLMQRAVQQSGPGAVQPEALHQLVGAVFPKGVANPI